MTEFEKEEFWKALGRLYDSSLNTLRATEELRKVVEDLGHIAELHEKRLDYSEVLLNALREEIKRLKKPNGEGK